MTEDTQNSTDYKTTRASNHGQAVNPEEFVRFFKGAAKTVLKFLMKRGAKGATIQCMRKAGISFHNIPEEIRKIRMKGLKITAELQRNTNDNRRHARYIIAYYLNRTK